MQIESIRARSEKQRRKVLQNFLVKWKVQEEERATEARAACRKWIANTGVSRIVSGLVSSCAFLEKRRTCVDVFEMCVPCVFYFWCLNAVFHLPLFFFASSHQIVEQRLHELRKDFYASPGIDPESVFLESMRTSLCNVFVIWLMATLFKKKVERKVGIH
jgi:hypothetical protein